MFPTLRDFRQMTQATETGILIHEASSKNILWANPAACAMFGFTLEELKPLKAHHMSSQEREYRRAVGVAWLQSAVTHGRSRRRWKYMAKSGQEFLTDAIATHVNFQDGPVVMVQFRNITEEVETKEELNIANTALNRMISLMSAGTLILDENFTIEGISLAAANLLGRPREELLNTALSDLGEVTPAISELMQETTIVGPGSTFQITVKISAEETSTKWFRGQVETIHHDGLTSRIFVFRDDTERVEWERLRDHQQANLQYLSRYNAMGDMAMMLAHELGQPISAARNYSSGLRGRLDNGMAPDRLHYALEQIDRQLDRASAIVSSVRNYVKRIESTSSEVDFNAVVTESLYFVNLRARELDVTIDVSLSPNSIPIMAESVLVGQVIINLCFNAVEEASRPESRDRSITVMTQICESYAQCVIRDHGRGITRDPNKSLASGIFSEKSDGAGIGLVISEHIMERHGGQIIFETLKSQGTRVTASLPLSQK
ncbi:ATP-binding protein [Kocuria sp. cx-455]|uniref:ATP-binding protein n=1 Tax=Kocuria sp. cx-455 TaxID=2771377 RepID=UPI003D7421BE